jgi:PAS domain S-box-containing protein
MAIKMNGSNPEHQAPSDNQALRDNAEAAVTTRKKIESRPFSLLDQKALIHELEVHQNELEMQKDELQRGRDEAEALKEKYLDLYDFAPVGYCTIDARGLIQEINLTGSTLLGKGRQEIVGIHFQVFLKPESQHSFNAFCSAALKTHEKQTCDVELLVRDSNPIYVRIEGTGTPDNKESHHHIRLAIIDITGLKCANAALLKSEERFRLALRNAPISIAIQDRDLVFRWAYNQRTIRPEDAIGKTDTDLFTPEDASRLISLKKKVLITGKEVSENIWMTMNGRRLFLSLFLEPLRDTNGTITGIGIATVDLTEQKMTEISLQESENRLLRTQELLEAVTKATDVIIAMQDTDYRYTYFNEGYKDVIRRLTGKDIAIGTSMIEVFEDIPEEQKRTMNEWSSVLHGENVNRKIEFGDPDNQQRVYHVLHTPIRDTNGTIVGAGEVAYDITRQVEVEDTLRETKEYLDNLINYANAPIIVWDPQFRITLFNRAFERLTGRNAEEVIGQHFEILLPDTYLAQAMDLIKKTSVGERLESVEIPIIDKNGEIRTVLWNSAAIFGTDEKTVESTIAQGQDITDRKKVESAYRLRADQYAKMNITLKKEIAQRKLIDENLKKTLSLLNASLESTADGILVVDRQGMITSYNQNFVNMWNIPRDLMKTREYLIIIKYFLEQIKEPEGFSDRMKDLLKHLSRESYDMIELKDGRIFERYSKPQKIGKTVVGRVWSYRDITDRKRSEKTLIASLQEKEVLLREIHHRVKNNLQLISGLLDMTRMRTQDETTTGILTDMMLKIQNMAQIHTRLYESKQFGKIGLTAQFRDQITALSNIYSHKGHEISCEINTQEIFLPVDQAFPCALAVNEILSNSYKHAFIGKKQGSIEIFAVQENGHVRITVRDDGIGLPENIDISRTNSLGLKLVRTLVQHQLKGTLTIHSRQGTETILEFPVILTVR